MDKTGEMFVHRYADTGIQESEKKVEEWKEREGGREGDRERERGRERETARQPDRQTDRHTHIHTYREKESVKIVKVKKK